MASGVGLEPFYHGRGVMTFQRIKHRLDELLLLIHIVYYGSI